MNPTKNSVRNEMLLKINNVSDTLYHNCSENISEKLITYINLIQPKTVHTFIPMKREINIVPVIEYLLQNKITVIAPKTLKNRMLENRILTSMDELEKGVFGTQHPKNVETIKGEYDLIIVPGVAFDKQNNRLGYGGGYYDTFLKTQLNAVKIGVGYPFQLVNEISIEKHDVPLNKIIY